MFDQKVAFKQSNLSRQFAASEDEEQQNNYIQLGSVLHNVFSTIRTKNDIDGALQRMELEGILYDQQLTREKIESLIRKRLSAPRVAEWYDAKWQLFNECSILNVDKQTGNVYERRPDRVMTDGHDVIVVDFKFGKPQAAYHEQVKEYMQLLSSMGCQHVKGYLWYVYSNKIDEVK
jgi:CRISPR/Cas system-associated exonuclease Cas4 (RecB family)